ncbi:pyrroline-5-carboxylate reductase [Candidatus Bathyarchaeota archaeon]|nr:pyrroline-5-carboxylate reductase [Candidatus Bathyarchaeota archaeon]
MKDSIAVIGAGVIGGAIVNSLLKSGYEGKITAAEIQLEKLRELEKLGIAVTSNNRKAAKESDVVFLCVKPNVLKTVLKEIRKEVEGKLVVSTAAAVTVGFCKRVVPKARFVRIMPNVAILVQESFTAYCCDDDVTKEDREKLKEVLDVMGRSMEVEEQYMDAVTAVSGSGPGYLSVIVEALTYAGLKVGLPRDLALISAAQAVLGTAKLVLETGQSAAQIRDSVTTPGGTTVEAIYEVEGSGIRQALMRAVEAATKKSEKIRKQWE